MDKSLLISIIRRTGWLTLIVLIAGTLLFSTLLKPYFLPVYILLLGMFFCLTVIYSAILIRAASNHPTRFVAWFMGTTALKMLLYFSCMILYLLFHRENAIPFLLTFLVLYFSYTSLAIYQTLKEIKKQ